jgi:hypothetical protein
MEDYLEANRGDTKSLSAEKARFAGFRASAQAEEAECTVRGDTD